MMDGEYQADCVLLVDDDYITNHLNECLLIDMQFCRSIEKTDNVEKALQFIEECYLPRKDPKSLLILLDINMPGLDGFDFLDELNSRSEISISQIEIIILSSSLHRIDMERAKKYTILDYLVKPLTPEKLIAALQNRKAN